MSSERRVIEVRGLSKAYRTGIATGIGSIREALTDWASSPRTAGGGQTLWALRDVSFDVDQGEVLGVIGANGAGKSTLLKILSRMTAPTAGEAVLRGRVGSLLEVGTGFHPELTGRENISLSGAILGLQEGRYPPPFRRDRRVLRLGAPIPRHAGQALPQRQVHPPRLRRSRRFCSRRSCSSTRS